MAASLLQPSVSCNLS